jgi:dTDP-4-dehydrorhamnose reductase
METEKPLVVVTGKDGQLGYELMQWQQKKYASYFNFLFVGRNELDLCNINEINAFIKKHQPQYFVNAAAYTAVDKAEVEQELAYEINETAPATIAKACAEINCRLIHISTDYVFDGEKKQPYLHTDMINPLNVYGASKAAGEKCVLQHNPLSIIIRTSWVYSSHGKNFVKTMLHLMSSRDEISVVDDQIGCPTYAADLAETIMEILYKLRLIKKIHVERIELKEFKTPANIYHYSNTGNISWFQFAQAIREIAHKTCVVKPIASAAYPTPAKRSMYSVMDTTNIVNDFAIEIKDWKQSLEKAIRLMEERL